MRHLLWDRSPGLAESGGGGGFWLKVLHRLQSGACCHVKLQLWGISLPGHSDGCCQDSALCRWRARGPEGLSSSLVAGCCHVGLSQGRLTASWLLTSAGTSPWEGKRWGQAKARVFGELVSEVTSRHFCPVRFLPGGESPGPVRTPGRDPHTA